LLLLALIAVLDVFFPKDHPNRYIAVVFQAIVLGISLLFLYKSYSSSLIITTTLHKSLFSFALMLTVYGIITPNLSILPVLLYALVFFYPVYYLTYKGYLRIKHIQVLAVFLLIVYCYETYLGVVKRSEIYDEFFTIADNVGYKSLYLMLFFSMSLNKPRNIIFLSVTYVLVLISLKRGAMIIGSLVYVIALWPIITGKLYINKKVKVYLTLLSIIVAVSIIYLVVKNWEILIFRFISDESGGSGRGIFWTMIVDGWSNANLQTKFFGFGLFAVPEFLRNTYGVALYAHSDWYELLFDHGIFGIIIYSVVILTAIFQYKIVYKYAHNYFSVYIMSLAIWLLKSYFSGVYINKGTIFLMLIMGTILAISYRNKHEIELITK